MKWITTNNLKNWAPQRDCQEHLPLLIRKLIHAECTRISEIQFPMGDNIVLSGWDGHLISNEATTYVPQGESVWEIGSRKDFKQKIEEDYKKRSESFLGDTSSELIYIAVTPYIWQDKKKWIIQKKTENKWKEVYVYDGLVLEEWIANNPVVGAWLAKYLGFNPNITPLDDFWDVWSNSSEHKISPALVLAGRESSIQTLFQLINERPTVIKIKASTIEEAIAFVAASVYKNESIAQEEIFSRAVIIENEKDFNSVSSIRRPLILFARFEDTGIINKAVKNGHHVIIPIGFDTTSTKEEQIILPRLTRKGFEDGLQSMGYSREDSESLTRDSGQNLSVLRRRLQFVQNQQPEWAKENNYFDILPALLAGTWDEKIDGDKNIIEQLAGVSYDEYISKLSRWKFHKDSPIVQIDSIWKLTSSLDGWSILAPFLLRKDFINFKEVCCKVIGELDPSLELDPELHYLSNLTEKRPTYSHLIKNGLCKSLALVGVFGDTFNITAVDSGQGFVNEIIYKILSDADGKKWCSLNYFLPLLAEASPEIFLQQVEEALSKKNSSINALFQETKGVFFSNSYHTGLLWGLESLAVSQLYLQRSSLLLAKLAAIDPGGQLVNRPDRSLREIFIPWYRQTIANIEVKKIVLKKISDEQPEVAWKLFLSLLPVDHDTVSPIHKFLWRFNEQSIEPTEDWSTIWNFYSFLIDKMLLFTELNSTKLLALIELLGTKDIPWIDREKIINFLLRYKTDDSECSYEVWNKLRKLVAHHRTYLDNTWALPVNELEKIQSIIFLHEPQDEILKSLHIFEDSWIELPEGPKFKELSYEKREELYMQMRVITLSSIYNKRGINGIFNFVERVKKSLIAGSAMAKVDIQDTDECKIIELLTIENLSPSLNDFIWSYINNKSINPTEWLDNTWLKVESKLLTPLARAIFFLPLPQNNHTWQLLEKTDSETISIYWKKITPWLYYSNSTERKYAITELQKVNRHLSILNSVTHFVNELPSELIAEILYNTATKETEEKVRIDDYDISKMFEALKEKGGIEKHRMLQLEWVFLDFLTTTYSEYRPQTLLAELTENPSFLVEIVGYIYRSDDKSEEGEEVSDKKKAEIWKKAYALLDNWYQIPGMNDEKKIDKNILMQWIKEVRKIGNEQKRLIGVDMELGSLLAYYPRNKDFWPCEEICEVIDSINSRTMLDSFKTAIFNSRGTYSKAAYEGGQQERNLSAYFSKMASLISPIWPFTASALQQLSKSYERDAIREDNNARIDELRY